MRYLYFLLAMLLAAPSWGAQTSTGLFFRVNCADIVGPVDGGTVCNQTTTTAGRTKGHLYAYRGTSWVDVDTGAVADGDKGDITVSSSGSVWTIDNTVVSEVKLSLADNTTGNVNTTRHGFAPKSPNDATKYLDGTGNYTVPAGGGGGSGTVTSVATTSPIGGGTITTTGTITCTTCVTSASAPASNVLPKGNGTQALVASSISDDGSTVAVGSGATGTVGIGQVNFTAKTAPSTPSSGIGAVYVDSTSKNIAVKDDAGTVKHGVQTRTAVSNSFATAIADDGTVTVAQPSVSNLSGFGTGVATALGVNVGSAGAPVLFNGAGGTPSSLVLTNASGLPTAALAADAKVRSCEVTWGSKVAAATAIANDDDVPFVCSNLTGSTITISSIECLAVGAADMTMNVSISGGSSVLTGNMTCGSGSFAAGTLSGTPTQSNNGSLDLNVISGSTATYAVMRIKRTL